MVIRFRLPGSMIINQFIYFLDSLIPSRLECFTIGVPWSHTTTLDTSTLRPLLLLYIKPFFSTSKTCEIVSLVEEA
jgi:hypothetical protein